MSEDEEFEFRHRLEQEASPSASENKAPTGGVVAIPSGEIGGQPTYGSAPAEPESGDNLMGKLFGLPDAALAMAANVPVSLAAGFQGSQAAGDEFMAKHGVQPKTVTGRKTVESIGDLLRKSGVSDALQAVPGLGGEISMLTRGAAPAATAAKALPDKAKAAVTPQIAPEVAALARKAQEHGIPLRPDMLGDNKILKVMGETSEKVPLSGSQADTRQVAFNKALIKQIGGDPEAKRLTPDVFDKAITRSGEEIGGLFSKTNIKIDPELQASMNTHLENASKFETADVQKIVTSYIGDLRSKAVDGVIPGEAFRKANTKIGTQMRNTQNGDLKHALGELQDDMHAALERNLTGDDLAGLIDARRRYAIAKTIEPMVAKSTAGDVSPGGLMGRVTANSSGKAAMARGRGGEVGDIARIGQRFLKEPNSSGTAERSLGYGLLGGGLFTHPAATAGAYTLANLYNRLGPKIARSLTKEDMDMVKQAVSGMKQ